MFYVGVTVAQFISLTLLQALLRNFGEKNRNEETGKPFLPRRIIIFRDGVSEGEFGKVNEQELPALESTPQD
jgi:hypothetical protein